jgi:hypothetical protein
MEGTPTHERVGALAAAKITQVDSRTWGFGRLQFLTPTCSSPRDEQQVLM